MLITKTAESAKLKLYPDPGPVRSHRRHGELVRRERGDGERPPGRESRARGAVGSTPKWRARSAGRPCCATSPPRARTVVAVALGVLVVMTIRPGSRYPIERTCSNASTGHVTQLDTLVAVGLPPKEAALILTVDWLLCVGRSSKSTSE